MLAVIREVGVESPWSLRFLLQDHRVYANRYLDSPSLLITKPLLIKRPMRSYARVHDIQR